MRPEAVRKAPMKVRLKADPTTPPVAAPCVGSGFSRTFTLCLLAVLCVLGMRVSAQFQMPDPKQMAGIPRPVTDLPNGTVSVRLIRGQLSNNITNFPVELHVGSDV